ncbi:MAG: hypothetical protein AAGK22_21705 [Acidobacteriota bacterium]
MEGVGRIALWASALVVGFVGAAGAQDLVAVAVDGNFGEAGSEVGVYAWSPSSGWAAEPIVSGASLPHAQGSAFGESGSIASGGAGCQVHVGSDQAVVPCIAGVCSGTPLTTLASGSAFPEAIAADDRFVFVFLQLAGALRVSRADTFAGTVEEFTVSLTRPQTGDVHDAMVHGEFVDVVMRYVSGGASVVDVVRLRKDGSLASVFQLGNVSVLAADVNLDTGRFYTVERPGSGGGWRIVEYDESWRRLGSVTSSGSVAALEESVAVVDGELFTFATNFSVNRYDLQGNRLGTLSPPPGTSSIIQVHARNCAPDDTKAFLGPDGRLEVTGEVTDFQGNTLPMRFPPRDSRDSTQTYVFDPANREGLFKALDACALNDRIWFFGALATTTRFTVSVRDRLTGATATFDNPRGNRAVAIEDTSSFPCN